MSRVGLIGENSIEYINKLLDIWNAGDCAVLIDWRIPFKTAVNMLKEASVNKCYIDKKIIDKYSNKYLDNISFDYFQQKNNAVELLSSDIYDKFRENYSKNEAIVLYSSGTTGKSKGIILSHFAINTNADAIIDYMKPNVDDCIYITKTLSHSSTLTGELLVALKTCTKLLVAPTIVPPRYILNQINKYSVSIICLNPTLLSLLSDEVQLRSFDISSLRTIYVSGSVLSDEIYEKAHRAFIKIPIYNVYGLTETGPRVTAQRIDCCKSNSVGKPIKGVDVVIVDESGKQVEQGEKGIVHVLTPSRFDGYIVGTDKNRSLYEKWLNTGDVGFIDKFCELHITDRVDDVLNVNSHKIYPSEIESAILENSNIKECVVIKVELSNREYMCCVYSGEKENLILLKQKLSRFLMLYEIPRYWVRYDVIPSNLNGKYQKYELKKIFFKNSAKEVSVI